MFTSVQTKMIVWTSGLVLSLGFISSAILLQPPSTLALKKAHAVSPAAAVRGPASALASSPPVRHTVMKLVDGNSLRQAVDLDLPCDGEQKSIFSGSVTQVRLSGAACSKGQAFETSEIRNDRNGFSATVFFPEDSKFTTDYLALGPGENRIRILHIYKNGTREERDYIIERE